MMRRGSSIMIVTAAFGFLVGAASGASAQQQQTSEGHPTKWQAIDKSMYDVIADGFDLVTVVYDTSQTGPQTDNPDVHYFLQKGTELIRCDFRKRDQTSFYWCFTLTKPNSP
jgi:hypothetical protein